MRLTVEQDVIFPFIPNDKVAAMKEEPIFQKYKIDAGNLTRGLVSCTGAQVHMQTSHPFMDRTHRLVAMLALSVLQPLPLRLQGCHHKLPCGISNLSRS